MRLHWLLLSLRFPVSANLEVARVGLYEDLSSSSYALPCLADQLWCARDASLRSELLAAATGSAPEGWSLEGWRVLPSVVTERRPSTLSGGLEALLDALPLLDNGADILRALHDEAHAFGEPILGALPDGRQFTADSILRTFLLVQAERALGFTVRSAGLIVEHGGGAALGALSFCRAGFRGLYLLHDLSAACALQRLSLSSAGIRVERDIAAWVTHRTDGPAALCVSSVPDLQAAIGAYDAATATNRFALSSPRLFVSTWALSETPLSERAPLVDAIAHLDAFFLTFQRVFGEGIGASNESRLDVGHRTREGDNVDYFLSTSHGSFKDRVERRLEQEFGKRQVEWRDARLISSLVHYIDGDRYLAGSMRPAHQTGSPAQSWTGPSDAGVFSTFLSPCDASLDAARDAAADFYVRNLAGRPHFNMPKEQVVELILQERFEKCSGAFEPTPIGETKRHSSSEFIIRIEATKLAGALGISHASMVRHV